MSDAETPDTPALPDVDQTLTWARNYPSDWPKRLCEVHLAMTVLAGIDLRHYRHQPRLRTTIWNARRGAEKVFKEMLADHRSNTP